MDVFMKRRLLKCFFNLAKLSLMLLVMGAGLALGTYWYFSRGLPDPAKLKGYRPPQASKVLCVDGQVCAEFFSERRTWVDITTLPKHVRDAFLAAEDADFYSHAGLDWLGILRSTIKNLKPGSMKTGASTISQQTCRRLLLTQERTVSRKLREWILTPRMEAALSKDEILNLYVNSIDFGNNRYGLQEASAFYFGKTAEKLSIGEAAVLAGTVQLPYRINPVANIVKAKKRQRYVLQQLARHHFLPQATIDAELEKPIVLGPKPSEKVGGYYIEEVRRNLSTRYGEKEVNEGGLKIDIAMDVKQQAAAEEAVRTGLESVDMRAGYRGPFGQLDLKDYKRFKPLIENKLAEAGRRKPDDVLVADLSALKDLSGVAVDEPDEIVVGLDEPIPTADEKQVRQVGVKVLGPRTETVGLVIQVDDKKNTALVDVVSKQVQVDFSSVKWARRISQKSTSAAPNKISEVFAVGDLISVRLGQALPASTVLSGTLHQVPEVQGALVSLDPKNRHVVAMVGGYDFQTSAFNRVTQAHRQPGSAFKPFLYGAAIASKKFTAVSMVNDAPEAIRDVYTGKLWKPQNYEKSDFEGPITLRTALTKSKNTVSVRLIEALTPGPVIEFARAAGLTSPLPENLTLALGTGEVSPLEITNAYATLQTQGLYAEPIVIRRVSDKNGRVLEDHVASPEAHLAADVAFVTTSLMRSVVEEGTAMAVLELKRPTAGKTGTAQEFRDAWFSGFTADVVTTAWVGNDDHSPIGPGETGGKAALPLWLNFMRVVSRDTAVRDFVMPSGVVAERINPENGLLAGTAMPGRLEYFLEGTAPTAQTGESDQINANDFLLHGEGHR
jgi:penicillin-binding protein 1A